MPCRGWRGLGVSGRQPEEWTGAQRAPPAGSPGSVGGMLVLVLLQRYRYQYPVTCPASVVARFELLLTRSFVRQRRVRVIESLRIALLSRPRAGQVLPPPSLGRRPYGLRLLANAAPHLPAGVQCLSNRRRQQWASITVGNR